MIISTKIRQIIGFLGLCCLLVVSANAQDITANPFELPERLGELIPQSDSLNIDSLTRNNPFVIVPPNAENTTINPPKETTATPNIWMGGIVLILGVLMALLNTVHRSELSRTYRTFGSVSTQAARTQKSSISGTYLLSYFLYIISAGAFIYLLGWYFDVPMLNNSIYSALACMGFVTSIFLAKHLLIGIISLIMPFDKELNTYNYVIGIFNHVIGIILIPFIIIGAFAPEPFKYFALIGGVIIIILIYIYRSIRGLLIGSKYLITHQFHFFLYLCAIEIAPLLILAKVLGIWR